MSPQQRNTPVAPDSGRINSLVRVPEGAEKDSHCRGVVAETPEDAFPADLSRILKSGPKPR